MWFGHVTDTISIVCNMILGKLVHFRDLTGHNWDMAMPKLRDLKQLSDSKNPLSGYIIGQYNMFICVIICIFKGFIILNF